MEKSIEKIWQDGFLEKGSLVVPKINDLYHRKSDHIIDKWIRMFKWNLRMLIFFGVVSLIAFFIAGVPWAAIVTCALWLWFVWYSKRQWGELKFIDKGASSYEYLSTFRNWLEEKQKIYISIYRFFLPAVIMSSYLGLLYIPTMTESFRKMSDAPLFLGQPIDVFLAVVAISLVFSALAGPIYRLDMKIMYGPLVTKLDELIADMEELRKEPST